MKNAKVNFKFKFEAKGVIALIAIIAFVLIVILYFALAGTQDHSTSAITESDTYSQPKQAPIEYIGNQSSKILHIADCRYVNQISERNVIRFTFVSEAVGYDSCSVCFEK